jgi:hypothetical protein
MYDHITPKMLFELSTLQLDTLFQIGRLAQHPWVMCLVVISIVRVRSWLLEMRVVGRYSSRLLLERMR